MERRAVSPDASITEAIPDQSVMTPHREMTNCMALFALFSTERLIFSTFPVIIAAKNEKIIKKEKIFPNIFTPFRADT